MCEQCNVNPLYFDDVLPGWTLIRARRQGYDMKVGQWGLLTMNSPDFIWTSTPKPDPTWGMSEEEEDKYNKEHPGESGCLPEDFTDAFINLDNVFQLGQACIKAGFDPNGEIKLSYWLWNYLGCWIRDNDPTTSEDAFPDWDNYNPHDYTIGKD